MTDGGIRVATMTPEQIRDALLSLPGKTLELNNLGVIEVNE